MANYKPASPMNYPVAWVSALEIAAARPGDWVDFTSAPTQNSGESCMDRARNMVKGIFKFPGHRPDLVKLLTGKRVKFRKYQVTIYGHFTGQSWGVQMAVVDALDLGIVSEILSK
jgi:hypothetical protein